MLRGSNTLFPVGDRKISIIVVYGLGFVIAAYSLGCIARLVLLSPEAPPRMSVRAEKVRIADRSLDRERELLPLFRWTRNVQPVATKGLLRMNQEVRIWIEIGPPSPCTNFFHEDELDDVT